MITQTIEKYKSPHTHTTSVVNQIFHSTTPKMGKLEFALYLKNLPYKVGDFLTGNHNTPPYNEKIVYRLAEIDEVHKFVTNWGSDKTGPFILTMENVNPSVRLWKATPTFYKKVDVKDLPKAWLERLGDVNPAN